MNSSFMLQLGYDCGLKTVDEAYSNIMRNYDMFFLIDNFEEEHNNFLDNLRENELIVNGNIINLSIEEAANKIGYTLQDMDYPELDDTFCSDMEDFELNI